MQRVASVVKYALMGTGAVVLGSTAGAIWMVRRRLAEEMKLPPEFVLGLDLDSKQVVDTAPKGVSDLADRLTAKTIQLLDLVRSLDDASQDSRVSGVVLVPGKGVASISHAQEIRDAILRFRLRSQGRAGTTAYTHSFGEGLMPGTGQYFLASGCQRVLMSPEGYLNLPGLSTAKLYMRGLLDRLHIVPETVAREAETRVEQCTNTSTTTQKVDKEYKSAVDTFTRHSISEPDRQQLTELLTCMQSQMVKSIAEARGLKMETVQELMEATPVLAWQAMAHSLISDTCYRSKVSVWRAAPPAAPIGGSAAALIAATPSEALAIRADATVDAGDLPPAVPARHADKAERRWKEKVLLHEGQMDSKAGSSSRTVPVVPIEKYIRVQKLERMARLMRRRRPHATASQAEAGEEKAEALPAASDPAAAAEKPSGAKAGPWKWGRWRGAVPWNRPKVQVVHVNGAIVLGTKPPVDTAAYRCYSDWVVEALQHAGRDATIKAVVLRIDSPGGSALASEVIHQEMKQLRDAGKVVVVSMGTVAASGGYYIATPANAIVANGATVTGSIGVIFGKPWVTEEAQKEAGLTFDTVQVGEVASMFSGLEPWSPEHLQRIESVVEATYQTFLQRVASGPMELVEGGMGSGRNMSMERARQLARGRIYTGKQARDLGLVDALGGIDKALHVACEQAGLSLKDDEVDVVPWSGSKPPWTTALNRLADSQAWLPDLPGAGSLAGLLWLALQAAAGASGDAPQLTHIGAEAWLPGAAAASDPTRYTAPLPAPIPHSASSLQLAGPDAMLAQSSLLPVAAHPALPPQHLSWLPAALLAAYGLGPEHLAALQVLAAGGLFCFDPSTIDLARAGQALPRVA